jgi:hypothetical protein
MYAQVCVPMPAQFSLRMVQRMHPLTAHTAMPVCCFAQEPLSRLDVDWELWGVLDMCSDEELETCESSFFCGCGFSPLGWGGPPPNPIM